MAITPSVTDRSVRPNTRPNALPNQHSQNQPLSIDFTILMMMRYMFPLLPLIVANAQDLASSQVAFGDTLTGFLYGNEDANQCSSALGISMMMSLLYPAMSEAAQTEARQVFGYPNDSANELVWADTTNEINNSYNGGECESCSLVSIANSVWVQENIPVDVSYATVLGDLQRPIDFQSATAGTMVNEWVEQATRGKIASIVEDGPLPSSVVLIALNAIYFKASWQKPFPSVRTSQDAFYDSDKSLVQRSDAIFMHQVEYFMYAEIPRYQIIHLPFSDGAVSMILAIPTVRNAALVDSASIIDVLPQLERRRVALGMPKFEFETLYRDNLKTAMANAGVNLPFAGGHLCIFENDCSPSLDIVLQKTFISVDENGVEAVAVTGGIVSTSLPTETPVEVLANLPFQFFIYEQSTGVMLFEGRIVDPIPGDSKFELNAKHSESDFWSANFAITSEPTRIFDNSPMAPPVNMPIASPVGGTPVQTPVTQPSITVENTTSSAFITQSVIVSLGLGSLLASYW